MLFTVFFFYLFTKSLFFVVFRERLHSLSGYADFAQRERNPRAAGLSAETRQNGFVQRREDFPVAVSQRKLVQGTVEVARVENFTLNDTPAIRFLSERAVRHDTKFC